MRLRLKLDQITQRARLSDFTIYLAWVIIAIVTTAGIVAIIGGLLIGFAQLLAN